MNDNLKIKTVNGMFWMFMERICAQSVTLIVSLVVARILIPSDFGIVAIAQIFINLANVFVVNGLNASLIQMKNPNDEDYSTAFYANLFVALAFYAVLFITSPYIAAYYNNDLLTPIFRVLGLRLILGAANAIQRAYVSKKMLFRIFFLSTLLGTIVSSFVGVVLAFNGYGPWAIVAQYLLNTIIGTVLLFITIDWKPKLLFSWKKLKIIFGFGFKVFVAALLNQLYLELRSLVIGKRYSSEDLAYFNRGNSIPQMLYTNIASAITSVMFPVLVTQNDNLQLLKNSMKKTISLTCYILFPIMVGLAVVAEPLLILVLTEKWSKAISFMQIYCVCYAVLPIQSIIEQVYKSIGRSDLLIKTFVVEKAIGVIMIVISMKYGVLAIAYGMLFTSIITVFIHILPLKKIMEYTTTEFIKDIGEPFILSLVMGATVLLVGSISLPLITCLLIQVTIGGSAYFLLSVMIRSEHLGSVLELFCNKVNIPLLMQLRDYCR